MNLEAWLTKEGHTLEWLAENIGMSIGSASRMVRGLQNIPLSKVSQIEALTNGKVTPAEMLATYREAQEA